MRLSANRRYGDGSRSRIPVCQLGEGIWGRAPRSRSVHPEAGQLAGPDRPRYVRCGAARRDGYRPAVHPQASDRAGSWSRIHGDGGDRARVLHLPRVIPGCGRAGLCRSRACRLVHRGLSHAPGDARGGLHWGRQAAPSGFGDPGRELEGRMGRRTARTERPLHRRPCDGGPPLGLQAMPQGSRHPDGPKRHLYGQTRNRTGRVQLPRSPEPLGGWRQCLPGRGSTRVDLLLGYLPMVPRGLDRARSGDDGVLCTHSERIQALPGRLLGSHATRLEPRQPDGRIQGCGIRGQPPDRVPDPGRRLQPLPGPGGLPGLGHRWHRETDRASSCVRGRSL